jgi:hypothetical protein
MATDPIARNQISTLTTRVSALEAKDSEHDDDVADLYTQDDALSARVWALEHPVVAPPPPPPAPPPPPPPPPASSPASSPADHGAPRLCRR